ncbi:MULTISPECIES: hypothetical protein [unclassified Cellulophaga]|uniref:hypothetical protein n=1 Tax=unclassified Cellulophaga TaxID=2634405 RepID=UPI0026E1E24F|nr:MULTISPECIES: hypothetical protein [unclassified Cellulophaga]MDO6492446.1 hypothetical protein [Cellulophaga sp. 2_MG-2023]MDO6496054.1 hypothetical protein [Cellulophaga sp. 3_MG-2023]
MKILRLKKITLITIILFVSISFIREQISLKKLENFKILTSSIERVRSKNYEITPIKGTLPILYDTIKNQFYLKNEKGLTKLDNQGNVMFSDDLSNEKSYISTLDYNNFVPFVFTSKGVYDFSGKELIFMPFEEKFNIKSELSNSNFKSIFEENYNSADLVIYGNEIEDETAQFRIYFRVDKKWILLLSQKGDYNQFRYPETFKKNANTTAQIDYSKFSSKFSNKKLIALKDNQRGLYSAKERDRNLNNYSTVVLKESKLDYKTTNELKMVAIKNKSYYGLPAWMNHTFFKLAYFELNYENEQLFFKGNTFKYNLVSNEITNKDFYLFELPKNMRDKTKVAFLDIKKYTGVEVDPRTNYLEPQIENTGIFIIKPINKN